MRKNIKAEVSAKVGGYHYYFAAYIRRIVDEPEDKRRGVNAAIEQLLYGTRKAGEASVISSAAHRNT